MLLWQPYQNEYVRIYFGRGAIILLFCSCYLPLRMIQGRTIIPVPHLSSRHYAAWLNQATLVYGYANTDATTTFPDAQHSLLSYQEFALWNTQAAKFSEFVFSDIESLMVAFSFPNVYICEQRDKIASQQC